MSNELLMARVGLVQRARGTGLVVRILIVVDPLVAILSTRIAARAGLMAADMIFLDALVVVLSVICVAYPDGHVGTAVLALLTAEWLARVDDPATPWALLAAVCFLVFHTSLAAACVTPPSARWTPAMCRRWLRRAAVLLIASAVTTLAVMGVHRLELSGSAIVLTAALTTLAVGGLWVSAGRRRPEPHP